MFHEDLHSLLYFVLEVVERWRVFVRDNGLSSTIHVAGIVFTISFRSHRRNARQWRLENILFVKIQSETALYTRTIVDASCAVINYPLLDGANHGGTRGVHIYELMAEYCIIFQVPSLETHG